MDKDTTTVLDFLSTIMDLMEFDLLADRWRFSVRDCQFFDEWRDTTYKTLDKFADDLLGWAYMEDYILNPLAEKEEYGDIVPEGSRDKNVVRFRDSENISRILSKIKPSDYNKYKREHVFNPHYNEDIMKLF